MSLHWLTKDDVEIDVACLPEDLSIEGSFASGDDEADARHAAEIRDRLEYTAWAWCCVQVTVTYGDDSACDYLGGCSYESEADFRADPYFEDMVNEALRQLRGPAPVSRNAFAEEAAGA